MKKRAAVDEQMPSPAIDKNDLDEEIIRQPEHFRIVADALALAIDRRDTAKWELEQLEAQIYLELRKKLDKKSYTETSLKHTVTCDTRYKNANKLYLQRKRKVERLFALRSSFEQRGSMLKLLASIWTTHYYEQHIGGSEGPSKTQLRHRAKQRQ